MHAEIAAAVAREHTPGLSPAACSRLEEALGRAPTVLELEVYAALLRRRDDGAGGGEPLQLGVGTAGAVALRPAKGRQALIESALDILAAGARPVAIVEGNDNGSCSASALVGAAEAAGAPWSVLPASAVAQPLGFASSTADLGPSAAALGLAVGLLAGPPAKRRPPAAGDVLIYLGVPTERDGPGRGATGAPYMPPRPAASSSLLGLLRTLHERPGLILAVRLVGAGGLAQAAVRGSLGAQLALDTIPRHPAALPPCDLLLAETGERALVVVAAEQIGAVLDAAPGQAVVVGSLIADKRLRVLVKPLGSSAARSICELPLAALDRELARVSPESRSRWETTDRPQPWTPQLLHELHARSERQNPLVVLRQGPLALAVCRMASAAATADASTDSARRAARQALSAALSHVFASGATPVCAAWFSPAAAPADLSLPAAIDSDLKEVCGRLGIAAEAGGSTGGLTEGLVVVIGENPPEHEVAVGRFPGPGCLLAILGFAEPNAEQERAAGLLCGELVRAGLCAAVQPITRGGLLLALGECCAQSGVGCTAVVATSPPVADSTAQRADAADREALCGQAPGRYLLAIAAQRQADARILASERSVPLWPLGRTGGAELIIRRSDGTSSFTELVRVTVAALTAERQPR